MLNSKAKRLFYILASPAMTVNGWIFRYFRLARVLHNAPVKLHLGPGQKNYIRGWTNIDANMFTGKCDLWADLRNPLPFPDSSVDVIYSHHLIEHLPDIERHLRDVVRVLKPGGIYRVAGPNGDSAIGKFIEGDHAWFGDWPDKFDSIGGRFANFILCRNEHLTILTESFLSELAERAGFSRSVRYLPVRETGNIELFADCLLQEHEQDFQSPHTLVLELYKSVN